MAKHAKTLQRLLARPTPTNITWDEVIGLLKHLGFEAKNNDGSRRRFCQPVTGLVISLHQPHPQPEIKQYVARQLAELLKDYGQH